MQVFSEEAEQLCCEAVSRMLRSCEPYAAKPGLSALRMKFFLLKAAYPAVEGLGALKRHWSGAVFATSTNVRRF